MYFPDLDREVFDLASFVLVQGALFSLDLFVGPVGTALVSTAPQE
jgi:hypothetical protein